MVMVLPPDNSLRQVVTAVFWITFGCGLPIAGVLGLVLFVRDKNRSKDLGRRLAGEMGLTPLTDVATAKNQWHVWYGGWHEGRPVAIKPMVFGSSSYDPLHNRQSVGADFYLRAVMAVDVPASFNVNAQRTHEDETGVSNLAEAFPTLENEQNVASRSREALLDFVRRENSVADAKARPSKAAPRNLRLCGRAGAPPDLISADVLPEAGAILVHDLPRAASVKVADLKDLLDDLLALAVLIEADSAYLFE